MSTIAHAGKKRARGTARIDSAQAMAIVLTLLAVTIAGNVAALLVAHTNIGAGARLALLLVPVVSSLLLALVVVSSYRHHRREVAEHAQRGKLEAGLFDPETGTFGPRYVEVAFHHELALAQCSHEPLVVLSAAFDYDRALNGHGPEAADHLVHVTAQILRTALRGFDIICHYNHGEFVVILPQTDLGQADIPCGRILHAVEQWNSSTRMRYRLALKVGSGDDWEGLPQALRDARLAARLIAPPQAYTSVGYAPYSSVVN